MTQEDEDPTMFGPPQRGQTPALPPLARVRITVSPSGEVRVFHLGNAESGRLASEVPDPQATHELSVILNEYIQDLYMEDSKELDRVVSGSQSLRELATQAIASQIDDVPYGSLVEHAPNAAGAISEYKTMLDRRMWRAMELAANNKGGQIRIVGQRARIKALPSVVHLQFDGAYASRVQSAVPPAPVDTFSLNQKVVQIEDIANGTFQSPFDAMGGGNGQVVGPIDGNPGDRFWGPGQPPPGEATGPRPGEDPNDPSWVDLPQDLYAKFLGERVKLPLLNRKPGQSRVMKTKQGGRVARMFGSQLPDIIMQNALGRGIQDKLADGEDPLADVDSTFDAGFENLQPRDIVVQSRRPAKRPDVKAVVTFVLDGSGSVAKYLEAFKRFVHDMKTVIAANYKGVAFRFIFFDHEAHILKDEIALFNMELGGGTSYSLGINKAKELFEEEYPRSQWDRYTFVMGDMEDSPERTAGPVQELRDVTEFLGVVAGLHHRHDPNGQFSLTGLFQPMAQSEPNVGWTLISPDGEYTIQNIREVLKNEPED
jgi:hypothetical protein